MINKIKNLFLLTSALAVFALSAAAQTVGEGTIAASDSNLTDINLPAGARRVKDGMVPREVTEVLAKLVAQGNEQTGEVVRQGESEVLLWRGDFRGASKQTRMIETLAGNLQKSGWTYEVAAKEEGVTFFVILRETPSLRALVGFFAPSEESFVFALTEMLPIRSSETSDDAKVSDDDSDKTAPVSGNGGNISNDLVGRWFRSSKKDISGLSGYTDTTFEFFADGTMRTIVEDESRDEKMCGIMAKSEISGTYTVSGERLTMNLKAGTINGKSSCGASGDFKKNLSASVLTKIFVVKPLESPFRPDSPAMLCLDGAPDKQCFERAPKQ